MTRLAVSRAAAPVVIIRPLAGRLINRAAASALALFRTLTGRYLRREAWSTAADLAILSLSRDPLAPEPVPALRGAAPLHLRLAFDIRLLRRPGAAVSGGAVHAVLAPRLYPAPRPGSPAGSLGAVGPVAAAEPGRILRARPGDDAGRASRSLPPAAEMLTLTRTLSPERAGLDRSIGVLRPPPKGAAASPADPTLIRRPPVAPSAISPPGPAVEALPPRTRTPGPIADDAPPTRGPTAERPAGEQPAAPDLAHPSAGPNPPTAPRAPAWRAPDGRPTRLTVRRRAGPAAPTDRRVLAGRNPPTAGPMPSLVRRAAPAAPTDLARPGGPATPETAMTPDRQAPGVAPSVAAPPLDVRRSAAAAPTDTRAGGRAFPGATPGSAPPRQPPRTQASRPESAPLPPKLDLDAPTLRRALNQLPSSDIAPLAEKLFEHFERQVRRGLERRGRL